VLNRINLIINRVYSLLMNTYAQRIDLKNTRRLRVVSVQLKKESFDNHPSLGQEKGKILRSGGQLSTSPLLPLLTIILITQLNHQLWNQPVLHVTRPLAQDGR
jgi:hypothetical protein